MISATSRGRSAAEALMADTFTAYAPTDAVVDADGMESPGFTDQGSTVGKLSGRSRNGDTNDRYVDVGGVERPVLEGGLHLPLSSPLPSVGWEYVCTSVGDLSDPSLVGRRFRVVDVPAKSYATARRLDVVEVS